MGIRATIFAASLFAGASLSAQDIPILDCTSASPIWHLQLLGDSAQFKFASKTIDFDLANTQVGEPGPWPVAQTWLARDETAIVILRPYAEGFHVDILTQRRQLPILLSGTCTRR